MKRNMRWGMGVVAGLLGCGAGPSAPTSSGPPRPATSMSPEFAALQAEGQRHSAIEGVVTQTNIVADLAGQAGAVDPNLKNAWGLAFNPSGPAWISANGNGTAQVYDSAGTLHLSVTIPPPSGGTPPSAPTGQIFNPDASTAFMGDLFILDTEDGTIAGWQPSADGTAVLRVDNSASGAVYKGIAMASPITAGGRRQLFAANFHAGTIDVFDDHYAPVTPLGSFQDPNLPAGFAPFNVLGVGPVVLVSYAKQDADAHDDVAGPGNGVVDLYAAEGFLLQRLVTGGHLNSPWAMVFAPDANDHASIDLAVGNFGDGLINVYNLSLRGLHVDARWEGALGDSTGSPLVIQNLWALQFGPGAGGFEADRLYFTAGPNDEMNGLFGFLTFTGPRR